MNQIKIIMAIALAMVFNIAYANPKNDFCMAMVRFTAAVLEGKENGTPIEIPKEIVKDSNKNLKPYYIQIIDDVYTNKYKTPKDLINSVMLSCLKNTNLFPN